MKKDNNDNEEEPDFYEEDESKSNQEDKKSSHKSSFDDETPKVPEKPEKSVDLSITMAKPIRNNNYNKNKPDDSNRILNMESDHNSKSDGDDNGDDNEPDFYEDEIIENPEESDNEQKEDENSKQILNKKIEEINKKNEQKNSKKIDELKKKGIELDNIYDINNEFNYDIDNPVFYLKENRAVLDKYPWPLSTKQVASIVEKEKIPYENLKVKLVDLFEFKLRNAYEYVDFMVVIKPEWASNVTYSKIFLDLYESKNKKEQNEKNKEKNKDKKEDKKENKEENKIEDKKVINDISQSGIPKVSQTSNFSVEKKFIFKMDENDEEKEQSNNNYQKTYARRKNRKKKRGKGVEIKGNFKYSDED